MENNLHNFTKVKNEIKEYAELTSESIYVEGNVGENSIIEAENLQVDGETLEDSTQFTRNAKINQHSGILRCHHADIQTLKNGEVHATTVNVANAFGGSIYAQDVTIDTIDSNLNIYASNSITVNLITGTNNTFKINYKDVPILNSKLDLIFEDLEDLEEELQRALKHNLSIVSDIKMKIQHLTMEKQSLHESYKYASILIKEPATQDNKIIFTLSANTDITYITQAKPYSKFHLNITPTTITLSPTQTTITLS